MKYSAEELQALRNAWNKFDQWSRGAAMIQFAIQRAYTSERRQEGGTSEEAMIAIMRMFHAAWTNANEPVIPSSLHTRAGLLRVYTATSKWLHEQLSERHAAHATRQDHIKLTAGEKLAKETIEPVLDMLDALHPSLTEDDVPSL